MKKLWNYFNNTSIVAEGLFQGWMDSLRQTLAYNERDSVVLRNIEAEEMSTLEKKKKLEFVADDLQLQIVQMAQYLSAITKFRGKFIT